MKSSQQVLLEAANLLTDEKWIQGHSSLDDHGREIYPDVKDACRWCTDGALQNRARGDALLCDMARLRILKVLEAEGIDSIEDWNDRKGRTAADVRALLRKAAALDDEDCE